MTTAPFITSLAAFSVPPVLPRPVVHRRAVSRPSSHQHRACSGRTARFAVADDAAPDTADAATMSSRATRAFDALGSSTRWSVAGAVFVALVVRRDASTLAWVVGALSNAVLSKVLKRAINQARPDDAVLSDPGMPSSHAMSLGYISTSVVGFAFLAAAANATPPWWAAVPPQATAALLWGYAALAASWRVQRGLHSAEQVAVGAVLGCANGAAFAAYGSPLLTGMLQTAVGEGVAGGDVGAPALLGVLVFGACAVGSVERKLSKLLHRMGGGSADKEK